MRWLAACTGKAPLAAGLALGLPGLILVFSIALASDVSWGGALGRGLVALGVLGGIGFVGGVLVQLAHEPSEAGVTAVGSQVDLTVGEDASDGSDLSDAPRPDTAPGRSPAAGSR